MSHEGKLYLCRPQGPDSIKMSSYQNRKSHCGDKTVIRSSYLHNGISYTGKMVYFYWISSLTGCTWKQQCLAGQLSWCRPVGQLGPHPQLCLLHTYGVQQGTWPYVVGLDWLDMSHQWCIRLRVDPLNFQQHMDGLAQERRNFQQHMDGLV